MDEENGVSMSASDREGEKPRPLPIHLFCVDIAAIFLLSFCIELLVRYVGPRESGFFCDDESIRLPYRVGTVSMGMLVFYCISLNLVLIFLVELYREFTVPDKAYSIYEENRSKLFKVFLRFAIFYGYYFAFELLISNITACTKHSMGRLRPHFIDVCRPIAHVHGGNQSVLAGCDGLEERYLTNYTCSGEDVNAINEARLSFFSGHTSLSMGCATYAILYLQYRLSDVIRFRLLVPIMQVILLAISLFISFSRILDDWHHWSDVACGMFVGTVTMLLLARFVAKFFVDTDPANCPHCSANDSTRLYTMEQPFVENF